MIKAVVFDAGETLINEARLYRHWAEYVNVPEHVFFASLGAIIQNREHHLEMFQLLTPGFDLAKAREERVQQKTPDRFEERDLYPDAAPAIRAIHAMGLRVAIAANQPQSFEATMRACNLPIEFVASSTRWGVAKPAPEFFKRIIDELQLPPAEIAYVGDRTDNDIVPAKQAGMFTVFIRRGPWGFIQARFEEAQLADLRIEGLLELPEALARLN